MRTFHILQVYEKNRIMKEWTQYLGNIFSYKCYGKFMLFFINDWLREVRLTFILSLYKNKFCSYWVESSQHTTNSCAPFIHLTGISFIFFFLFFLTNTYSINYNKMKCLSFLFIDEIFYNSEWTIYMHYWNNKPSRW